MMHEGGVLDMCTDTQSFHGFIPLLGVCLDHVILIIRKCTGLGYDGIRNQELADIMEKTCLSSYLYLCFIPSKPLRDDIGNESHVNTVCISGIIIKP